MNRYKRAAALVLALALMLSITACGSDEGKSNPPDPNILILQVFAPKSAVGVVSTAVNAYSRYTDNITIQITYDDGAMLASKIEAGYDCDIYIADSADYMDWLDASSPAEKNPNENDLIIQGSRTDVFKGTAVITDDDGNETTEEITYTAAVIKTGKYPMASQTFIEFLRDAAYEEADEAYETYGFTKIN